mgnify:CR=1 FL=1
MGALLVAMLLSTPRASACDAAYDSVVQVARSEANFGYAHEVSREGRRAFVAACVRHLSRAQVRCIARARSSDALYVCTP